MKKYANGKNDNYKIFIDSQGNLWVSSSEKFAVGYRGGSSWKSISGYVVRDVAEDQSGHILLATDHDGLVEIDRQGHQTMQWLHDDNDRMRSPTIPCSVSMSTIWASRGWAPTVWVWPSASTDSGD